MNDADRKVMSGLHALPGPVFSLDEAVAALAPRRGRAATLAHLHYYLQTGRLKLVARGLYAVVPPGQAPEDVHPDPFLVAVAARPDAVFCHHAALELLGTAHSAWQECTAYTNRRRRPVTLQDATVRFLVAPRPMADDRGGGFATRKVERLGRLLVTTGPERTLVEGFRRPALAGGLEELVLSASAFPTLDLVLLEEVLERYGVANLWSAAGWFLERFQHAFHVPDATLDRLSRHVPSSPQYFLRARRGGRLHARWNLIVPDELESLGGPDEAREEVPTCRGALMGESDSRVS